MVKKKKILGEKEKKQLKLINPVMRFDAGFLEYKIDIPRTKRLLRWLKKKKI